MAIPESPMDKIKYEAALHAIASAFPQTFAKMENARKASAVATVAAAVISNAGRALTIQEALDVQRDIYFATYGGELAGHGSYQEWAKTKETRLNTIIS
jgi:hypothetical protein